MGHGINRRWTFSRVKRRMKTQANQMNNPKKAGKAVETLLRQWDFKRAIANYGSSICDS